MVKRTSNSKKKITASSSAVEEEKEVIVNILEGNERLALALDASNYKVTLSAQRKNARLKLNRFLSYPYKGGMFYISRELVSFISSLLSDGKSSGVLLDSNENPIEVVDLQEFYDSIVDRYYQGMNDYLAEYKEFQKARNVKSLIFSEESRR